MSYNVRQLEKRRIAGFHLVGPWNVTVKQGFKQLMMWVDSNKIAPLEWVCAYYDNPDEVPPEKLRADVAITVDADFQIPANSEGVILTDIPGGQYAVAQARVYNEEFEACWDLFFDELLSDQSVQIAAGPCFEVYLNDAQQDGYWEIDMHIPVEPKNL
ncbi:DNA gyrase inhibitor SbmC [Kosakonia radicincitans]|uniref:DNA gyrase inhibitor n=1 Tax=Kosakonia radicincitans TaxID=283686 RepID=A0AAX2EV39_9ENTR|nr:MULTISPECIES: DNA gyrase inhibitor SbmC [Kosakonia]MDP9567957.1 DNA gyrase inhibitor [Kosakonia oryzae]APG18773.1 DNA gyrase inhibitor [Kosakonia radicincitans]KDE34829.1 DNA gyrase inhibitor [Kosakonia radicincitans UMEnt01/12]NCF05472.1 DNA gyrase inhibitor SbmC [Kosakonia sp. MH5]QEM90905.1 DNA gyrase inhibitor SbmC [Kosakonia radicincitans]